MENRTKMEIIINTDIPLSAGNPAVEIRQYYISEGEYKAIAEIYKRYCDYHDTRGTLAIEKSSTFTALDILACMAIGELSPSVRSVGTAFVTFGNTETKTCYGTDQRKHFVKRDYHMDLSVWYADGGTMDATADGTVMYNTTIGGVFHFIKNLLPTNLNRTAKTTKQRKSKIQPQTQTSNHKEN